MKQGNLGAYKELTLLSVDEFFFLRTREHFADVRMAEYPKVTEIARDRLTRREGEQRAIAGRLESVKT